MPFKLPEVEVGDVVAFHRESLSAPDYLKVTTVIKQGEALLCYNPLYDINEVVDSGRRVWKEDDPDALRAFEKLLASRAVT